MRSKERTQQHQANKYGKSNSLTVCQSNEKVSTIAAEYPAEFAHFCVPTTAAGAQSMAINNGVARRCCCFYNKIISI